MNTTIHTMQKWQPKALAVAISCAYLSLALVPAYASDTEIYVEATKQADIAPNLMMMFDTSGSMAWCMDSDNTCSSPNKRIDILKDAMQKILRGTPTVKPTPGYVRMGLGRFHPTNSGAKGGYISYPARPLDALVEVNPNGVTVARGASGKSDAMEASSSDVNGADLRVGINDGDNYAVGLHFAKVRIPKGATISDAYVQLVAKSTDSGLSTWEIASQAISDAPDFNGTTIASRTYGAPTAYQPDSWTAGEMQQIPVTAAIQEVVSRDDWCGDNAIALRFRDVGSTPTKRRAYSFEGAGTNLDLQPQLVVNYTIDPEKTDSCIKNVQRTKLVYLTDNNDDVEWWSDSSGSLQQGSQLNFNQISDTGTKPKNITGLYYRDLAISSGAQITGAYLVGQSSGDYTDVKEVLVNGINQSNLVPFCSPVCITPAVANVLPKTSASVFWTPAENKLVKNKDYVIDVSGIVQEIVNQPTWAQGQGMAFTMANNTNTNNSGPHFKTRDSTTTKSVQLQLSWIEPLVTNLSVLETVRDQLEAEVLKLEPTGGTPLGSAYAEASRYLYGMTPYNTLVTDYDYRTVTTSAPIKYVSPIPATDECSANFIFLLTDGDPTIKVNAQDNTQSISNNTCAGSNDTATNWDCLIKLATYNAGGQTNQSVPQPKKKIRTNTVILGPLDGNSETKMKELAAAGGGSYYKSEDVEGLIKAISETVDKAISLSGSISAAGVAVNQLSRLTHLNQLYYSVFEPKPQSYRWDGNLKRYTLGANASAILDVKNDVATDDATGFFKDDAKSFWSTSTDGKSALLGGAANVLPSPNDRKMFTYMGALTAKNVALTPIDLTNSAFNTSAKAATGVSDDNVYTNLMNWYKGYQITSLYDGLEAPTNERKQIGAALHSQPVLVNYGYNGTLADASNADNQKNYVFFSTLEGTLHAIKAKTGEEVFSFIPGEKLSTLKTRFDNPIATNPEFGMDLTWTSFRSDADFSGQINSSDKLYLYGGMRMGGSNYYALNVTNLNAPSLLFAIEGGVGNYKSMGQTWSQPVLANIKVGGTKRTVIVFGGGYDPRHETANQIFTDNDKGNQLYVVDAFTGELIWFASGNATDAANSYIPDMKFSVPSSPEILDMTGDGVADAIYFGDLGGQVFRVDLNSKAGTGADLAKRVRLLAKVGQTESATTANQRRFYEPPAVAVFKDSAGVRFATVGIGSGYRSHPLNLVTEDRYFVLFDRDVTRLDVATAEDSTLQGLITTANLAELDLNSSIVQTNGVDVTNKKGWYVDLAESGEKSFSQGVIFKSQLLFTTYSPSLSGSSNCSPVTGKTNLYKFCMPYGKLCDGASYLTPSVTIGLSGQPQLIVSDYDDNGVKKYSVTPLIGTKLDGKLETGDGKAYLQPTKKWREKTINE